MAVVKKSNNIQRIRKKPMHLYSSRGFQGQMIFPIYMCKSMHSMKYAALLCICVLPFSEAPYPNSGYTPTCTATQLYDSPLAKTWFYFTDEDAYAAFRMTITDTNVASAVETMAGTPGTQGASTQAGIICADTTVCTGYTYTSGTWLLNKPGFIFPWDGNGVFFVHEKSYSNVLMYWEEYKMIEPLIGRLNSASCPTLPGADWCTTKLYNDATLGTVRYTMSTTPTRKQYDFQGIQSIFNIKYVKDAGSMYIWLSQTTCTGIYSLDYSRSIVLRYWSDGNPATAGSGSCVDGYVWPACTNTKNGRYRGGTMTYQDNMFVFMWDSSCKVWRIIANINGEPYVKTVLGDNSQCGASTDGPTGYTDGTGTTARFQTPLANPAWSFGDTPTAIYIHEPANAVIRKITWDANAFAVSGGRAFTVSTWLGSSGGASTNPDTSAGAFSERWVFTNIQVTESDVMWAMNDIKIWKIGISAKSAQRIYTHTASANSKRTWFAYRGTVDMGCRDCAPGTKFSAGSCVTCTDPNSYCTGGTETSCTPACTGANYESVACTRTTNRVCTPCTTCTSGTQYQTAACTSTTNTQCRSCSTCNSTQYESRACSGSLDRQCTTIPTGVQCTASYYYDSTTIKQVLYFCNTAQHTIEKLDLETNTLTTIAGISGTAGTDSSSVAGPATSTAILSPSNCQLDKISNILYFKKQDSYNPYILALNLNTNQIYAAGGKKPNPTICWPEDTAEHLGFAQSNFQVMDGSPEIISSSDASECYSGIRKLNLSSKISQAWYNTRTQMDTSYSCGYNNCKNTYTKIQCWGQNTIPWEEGTIGGNDQTELNPVIATAPLCTYGGTRIAGLVPAPVGAWVLSPSKDFYLIYVSFKGFQRFNIATRSVENVLGSNTFSYADPCSNSPFSAAHDVYTQLTFLFDPDSTAASGAVYLGSYTNKVIRKISWSGGVKPYTIEDWVGNCAGSGTLNPDTGQGTSVSILYDAFTLANKETLFFMQFSSGKVWKVTSLTTTRIIQKIYTFTNIQNRYGMTSFFSDGCVLCPNGKYLPMYSSTCIPCEPGFFCLKGIRTPCPANQYQYLGAETSCLPCTICSGSEYQTMQCNTTTNRQCLPCTTVCPPYTYMSTNCSSDQNSQCIPCSDCKFMEITVKTCQQDGNVRQNTECVLDYASCIPELGFAVLNNSVCQKKQCVQCPAGSASTNNTCSVCPSGYYAFNGNCVVCTENYFCVNGTRTACTPPTFSSTGQSFCLMCQAGTYSDGSICVPCPQGYYCTNGTNLIPCIPGK